ncbi:hypothetical protein [Paenibacillus sinopodophylli]|uniref:hypothetical protein n=1 Tax=Paenibacillus sinopodophylli TaxID=1837342 RepID=UPI00110D13FA|nr:hypothetical protein [Paenibacillus sinopodophylli]
MTARTDDSRDKLSEWEQLIEEKIKLGTKLGLMGKGAKLKENFKQTKEYQRINEIDVRLRELVK